MSTRSFSTLALVAITLSAACDGPPGPPPPTGPLADVFDGVCAYLDRCPEGIGSPIVYRNRRECIDILNWAATCRLTSTEIADDVEVYGLSRTMIELEPAAAQACLEWIAAAECGAFETADSTPCQLAFAGEDGENPGGPDRPYNGPGALDVPCEHQSDCQSELYCTEAAAPDPNTGAFYCRVCRPRIAAGELCTQVDGDPCAYPTRCRYQGEEYRCLEQFEDGATCNSSQDCASGFCRYTDGEPSAACDPGGRAGDACEGPSGCREGLYCDDAGACQERRRNGESCGAARECYQGECEAGTCGRPNGAACDYPSQCARLGCVDSVCVEQPPGTECYSDAECLAPLLCNEEVRACAMPGDAGAPCRRNVECISGRCNDFDDYCEATPDPNAPCSETGCDANHLCDGVNCVPKPGPGEACQSLDACAQPFICREGVCQLINLSCEPAPAGAQCASLRVCAEDAYCDFFDGITCKPRHALGEECSSSRAFGDSCAAGLRCSGTCIEPVARGGSCAGGELCEIGVECLDGVCGGPGGSSSRTCNRSEDCPESEQCDDDTYRCAPRRAEGERCYEDRHCAAALRCDGSSCAPRLAQGESCNENSDCEAALFCSSSDSYVCQPRVPVGSACQTGSSGSNCAEGAGCRYDTDLSEYRCVVLRPGGAACTAADECLSGYCIGDSAGSTFCANSRACTLPE